MKKIGLVILGMGVLLIGIFSFNKEENRVLVEEKLNNQNTSLVFMLEDKKGTYNISENIPSGYSLNTSKSVCSNNTIPTWEDHKLYLNNLNKNGTSCYLYFDEFVSAKDEILADKEIKIRSLPLTTSSKVEDLTTGTIYKAQDDWGDTYYFAGNPSDNWLKFAGFYWRIIRINGDGSIRMIYQGASANTTGTGTQIQTSAFNSSYNSSEYVGYMYTTNQQHGNTTNSTIKGILDTWYSNNLKSYADKISTEAGFCGDREMASGSSWSSTPSSTIYYAGYGRLAQSSGNVNPTFKCSNSSDLYTTSSSSKGNKALSNPIGLITADEVTMAGLPWSGSTTSNYLYTNQSYWTMSPCAATAAVVFFVTSTSFHGYNGVDRTYGVRPVINLASDVTLSGTGTVSDPYVVEGAE